MCGLIGAVFVMVAAAMIFIGQAIAVIGAIVFGWFIIALAKYNQAKKLTATPMICPNCQSTNIRIQSRVEWAVSSGGATGTTVGVVGAAAKRIQRSHVGVCQDCGFDYPYYIQSDIDPVKQSAENNYKASLLCLVIYIAALVYFFFIK